ncbi:MAG: quinone-dependent dihydroorotate dehydrogenase [Deltaproteobacteria bacterium]|nr:quinone-dependent dihydroorotate dehydrogenase [Deltaproteobacteria bacterium]
MIWKFLRKAFFTLDAEKAHDLVLKALASWSCFCRIDLPKTDIARNPTLRRQLFGVEFPNPLGLAAGFDKNGVALPAWQALGFGFVEVGTVTAKPQTGNPKPRLFRLPEDQALLNRLGFNNEGARCVAERIEKVRKKGRVKVPVGVNIGKSKVVPLEQASQDYLESFSAVADVADYLVINVSSPNTPGLRDLQEEGRLSNLLDTLSSANQKRKIPRPLLLKLSPDLSDEGAIQCGKVSLERGLVGLIVTNTTISREGLKGKVNGDGGISGQPLFKRSTEMLEVLKKHFGDKLVLIGVGGVMDGNGAKKKREAGADLLQTYTGFVYGGPSFPRWILKQLIV